VLGGIRSASEKFTRTVRLVDDDRRLRSVPTEPTAVRIRQLTARAGRAGYRLERASRVPYDWMLIDAEDDTTIYSAADLDQIERWLDE
uniref:hypothetical protein n=1 Tax=Nocardia anaemiae TaxID=263910 RepID=UPI000B27AE57